jgi:hypothetical protein
MRRLPILVVAASAIALAGCQGVSLEGPVALDGLRPDGGPCDPLAAPNFRAVNIAETDIKVGNTKVRCPAHEIGMRLQPGMVLWLATPTWGPALGPGVLKADQSGTDPQGDPIPAVDIPLAAGNRAPQVASELRLPVRKLGPNGRMTDEEATVLGAFLSLQRKELFGAADDVGAEAKKTSEAWRSMFYRTAARAALWNAFVDASSLRRITPTSDIAPEPEHQQPLSLVINPANFCKYAKTPKAGNNPSLALNDSELSLLVAGLRFGAFDCTTYTNNVEVFALRTDEKRADPLAALTAQRGPLNKGYFLDDAVANPASFVSAQLGVVSMRAEGAERRWSLAEWEESQVCGAGRLIARIHAPGTWPDFGIVGRVDAPQAATFSVVESMTTVTDPGSKFSRVVGIERRIAPEDGRLQFFTALDPQDLTRLWPTDIDYLEWTGDWGGRGRDPCRR